MMVLCIENYAFSKRNVENGGHFIGYEKTCVKENLLYVESPCNNVSIFQLFFFKNNLINIILQK